MAPYTYTKLDRSRDEFRLMRLFPGKFEDEIAFAIFHTRFPRPPATVSSRMSVEELQKTLPDPENWMVGETLDGLHIFGTLPSHPLSGKWPNSFEHPNPDFDHRLYISEPAPKTGPDFEALSYTWGDSTSPVMAEIVSSAGTVLGLTMPITRNLALALRHLRREDEARTLWVDAVCINQEDIAERNVEVKRMRDLYTLAPGTIIWLGEESDTSSLALNTINHFGNQIELFVHGSTIIQGDAPGAVERAWSRRTCRLPYSEATWSSLEALLRRPWFERIWVWQEAILSGAKAVVQCGSTVIPWLAVHKLIIALSAREGVPVGLSQAIWSHADGMSSARRNMVLRFLRWASRHRSTDPRDKVYGLLGLLPEAVQNQITVDYAKPASQVYIDIVLAELAVSKRLSVIQNCFIGDRMPGAPSWVLNLARAVEPRPFYRGVAWFSASLNSAAVTRYVEPGLLEASGVRCASIHAMGPAASGAAADRLREFIAWESTHSGGPGHLADTKGTTRLDSGLYALLAGCFRESAWCNPAAPPPTLEEVRSHYLRAVKGDDASIEAMTNYIETYGKFAVGNLFLTEEGYIGIGPSETRPGDHVCALLGLVVLIVLRPTSTGDCVIVGSCAMGGFVGGEIFAGPVPDPWNMVFGNYTEAGVYEGVFFFFRNSSTGETRPDDPRLPSLPSDWEATHDAELQPNDWYHNRFENKMTGEVVGFDPRMTPKALKNRGVNVEVFRIT